MSDFRDKDPEDAYDATDPPSVRLDVLERIVADLEADVGDPRFEARRRDALRLVANLDRVRGVEHRRLRRVRRALEAL